MGAGQRFCEIQYSLKSTVRHTWNRSRFGAQVPTSCVSRPSPGEHEERPSAALAKTHTLVQVLGLQLHAAGWTCDDRQTDNKELVAGHTPWVTHGRWLTAIAEYALL